jgi:type IV secretory pathway protease TraF
MNANGENQITIEPKAISTNGEVVSRVKGVDKKSKPMYAFDKYY